MSDDAYNNSNDASYGTSNAETTPSQRMNNGPGGMSDAAKRRVDQATTELTGTRCLIENTAQSNHVEYTHCLKQSTDIRLLDRFQFVGNKYARTTCFEFQLMSQQVSAKFQKAFDSGKWLLPETTIIDTYYNALHTPCFPHIEDNVYKYTLIAHPDMESIPIHRQADPPPVRSLKLKAADFTYYAHPYHNLPVINSHVHPRFIICNSGSKLTDLLTWTRDYGALARDDMMKVQAIWLAWKEAKPTEYEDTPQ